MAFFIGSPRQPLFWNRVSSTRRITSTAPRSPRIIARGSNCFRNDIEKRAASHSIEERRARYDKEEGQGERASEEKRSKRHQPPECFPPFLSFTLL